MSLPESNGIVVRPDGCYNSLVAMSGRHITQDVTVEFVLILFSISCHVIRVKEITSDIVNSESFGKTRCGLLIFGDRKHTDFLGSLGGGETAFLLEGDRTGTDFINRRHDCGLLVMVSTRVDVSTRNQYRQRILKVRRLDEQESGFSAGLVLSPVCCLESCVLDTVSYRDGNRRQLRLWRMSTDINVVFSRCALEGGQRETTDRGIRLLSFK